MYALSASSACCIRGFSFARSEAQFAAALIFAARDDIRGVQTVISAEHVASRVCVMWRTDLEASKNEFEFWRSIENGRHAWKVEFLKKSYTKFEQLSVMFPLNPWSKGDGN